VRLPSRLTVLTTALVVLLPVLAVLQFRWLGQLSAAERDRMQRNLATAAGQFREAFDGEIVRAFASLQVDSAIVRDQAWTRYAERYAAWTSTAPLPGLISNVFLIDAEKGDVRLRRWNTQARVFEPAEWSGPIASSREHFKSALAAFAAGEPPRREAAPFRNEDSLLVAPLINVHIGTSAESEVRGPLVSLFGFTVLQLDMLIIEQQVLPELTRRHFHRDESDAYRVAIVDADDPRKVIYRSSPEAPTDPARAEINEPLFAAQRDPMVFLARGGAPRAMHQAHNVLVSVIRERRGNGTFEARVAAAGGASWRLLVQHERGSLDAAVTSVRRRNLVISSGIMLLMAVSIGLLALSSRRAQHLARQQMEFVAGVSHELRTPVAVIRSAGENLAQGVVFDNDRVRKYGDAIHAESLRLGEMVERVLQFAGIDSGRPLARTPLAIEPLISDAVDATLHTAGRFTVDRHVAPDLPPVAGDAALLRSAIGNLIANAAKYGGPDRWIGVRADTSSDSRDVRITVSDHGSGISSADLPHIFDPFYRGSDATARQVQGSGLGLALVRRIAEAHGGRVTVVTHEGAGTAFTLHVPAAAGHAATSLGDLEPAIDPTR
jgi:signal transduction histidine kinase